jgi:hypothetical protein
MFFRPAYRSGLLTNLLFLLSLHIPMLNQAQVLSPNSLVTRSIQFHDPQGKWENTPIELYLLEERPQGTDRHTIIGIDLYHQSFHLDQERENHRIQYQLNDQSVKISLDGQAEFTNEQKARFQLTEERAVKMRDYYTYLYGLPMKLRDPGTIFDPYVRDTVFQDESVWSIRVTYQGEVGSDIWYFYFDKESYALQGYRFYHNEAAKDGEYIVLEGLKDINGIRLPKTRSWYTNHEHRFLGRDILN